MTTQDSLKEFLSEGQEIAIKHDVTDLCLVLWGHNFGLGFGRDHDDPLMVSELANALEEFATQRGGKRLELLATNSCTMAYIEAAFELKTSVKYLVASQVYMPLKGFPYSSIVRSISSDTKPEQLGRVLVKEYFNSFAVSTNGEKVGMSLLDLDGAEDFRNLLRDTARTIQQFIQPDRKTVVQEAMREIRDVFLVNPAGDVRPVLDLQSLAQDLIHYCDDSLAGPDRVASSKSLSAVEQSQPGSNIMPMQLRESGTRLLETLTRKDTHGAMISEAPTSPKLVVTTRQSRLPWRRRRFCSLRR